MTNDVRVSLTRIGSVVAILATLAALVGPYLIFPYRMEAAERRLDRLEQQNATIQELLWRIDENVKVLKERQR